MKSEILQIFKCVVDIIVRREPSYKLALKFMSQVFDHISFAKELLNQETESIQFTLGDPGVQYDCLYSFLSLEGEFSIPSSIAHLILQFYRQKHKSYYLDSLGLVCHLVRDELSLLELEDLVSLTTKSSPTRKMNTALSCYCIQFPFYFQDLFMKRFASIVPTSCESPFEYSLLVKVIHTLVQYNSCAKINDEEQYQQQQQKVLQFVQSQLHVLAEVYNKNFETVRPNCKHQLIEICKKMKQYMGATNWQEWCTSTANMQNRTLLNLLKISWFGQVPASFSNVVIVFTL